MFATVVIFVLGLLCACLLAAMVLFGLAARAADAEAAEMRRYFHHYQDVARGYRAGIHAIERGRDEMLAAADAKCDRLTKELQEARAELDWAYQRPGATSLPVRLPPPV